LKRKRQRIEWQEQEKVRLANRRKARQEPKFKLPRLKAEERKLVERNTRTYSMLDYLYRLRLRTNYGDAAVFTDGPETETDSKIVRVALIRIVSTSIYASELILATATDGRASLQDWADTWIHANVPPDINYGVKQRLNQW
jgi:hypothetical protein